MKTGAAPSAADLSLVLQITPTRVVSGLDRLHDRHLVVLDPVTRDLVMAGPFSAVPTGFKVVSGARQWWANCIWDALGVASLLRLGGRIETRCGDCDRPMTVFTEGGRLAEGDGITHLALPAAEWWEDIGFT